MLLVRRTLPLFLVACIPVLESPAGTTSTGPWTAPENSWGLCEGPPEGFVGEGLGVGEVAPDFLMLDQYGQDVSLWQFHGCPIVLDFSTMWCAPCQELAEEAPAVVEDYADDDLVYLTVMPQDLGSDPPDQEELTEWMEAFELTAPILSDETGYTYQLVTGSRGFPAVLVLDRDGVVATDLGVTVTDEAIRAAIDDVL